MRTSSSGCRIGDRDCDHVNWPARYRFQYGQKTVLPVSMELKRPAESVRTARKNRRYGSGFSLPWVSAAARMLGEKRTGMDASTASDSSSSTPVGQALPAGTRLEEFVVERLLGSGGFGITYLARDESLGRLVVVKENLPAQFCFRDPQSLTVAPRHTHADEAESFRWSMENFRREAATLASLDHPGIVRVLRSLGAFGTAYFVMPFVEGRALDELAERRRAAGGVFTKDEVEGLLWRVLEALGYLHERAIYHRDIKPGNISITREGRPVLIDFGSARQRLGERSMTVVESPGYTPFEQLQSRGDVGPWSDLYALGATLARVITGESLPKATDRILDDQWEPLSGRAVLVGRYGGRLLAGIDKALRPRGADRWREAGQWLEQVKGTEREPSGETRVGGGVGSPSPVTSGTEAPVAAAVSGGGRTAGGRDLGRGDRAGNQDHALLDSAGPVHDGESRPRKRPGRGRIAARGCSHPGLLAGADAGHPGPVAGGDRPQSQIFWRGEKVPRYGCRL